VKAEEGWELWSAKYQQLAPGIQKLKQTVTELEPLRVWSGHPCRKCKRPMAGVVAREDAARLMQNFGHAACMRNDSGPGLGALAAGAAALYALSQVRKGA